MTKITPTKKIPHFKKYNCSGKLRVDILTNGDINEVILLPENGGCKHNLQLIGRLITLILECNIDIKCLLNVLEKTDPCPAPISRMNREKLPREEIGIGGCSKIILTAILEKLNEITKKETEKEVAKN
jgi:hypothetical protein